MGQAVMRGWPMPGQAVAPGTVLDATRPELPTADDAAAMQGDGSF